ncbi:MAG: polyphosphate kinase 1 [Acidobacteriota bacterium]
MRAPGSTASPASAETGSALTEPIDLHDPQLFLNRELGLVEFNRRVLEQAKDEDTPLLERLRFLTISCTNLDELFEVRVAGLKQQLALGMAQVGPEGLGPHEALERIGQETHELVAEQYRVFNEDILTALEKEGIRIVLRRDWDEDLRSWAHTTFELECLPVLTPMGLDPAHPFPKVLNKGLNFLVRLQGRDAFGRNDGVAIVQVPRSLPRVLPLPSSLGRGRDAFVLLSSVVRESISSLFPGMEAVACHQFRVTRNSDLWVDEEEAESLLHALKGGLPSRNYGEAVRLELDEGCSEEDARFLLDNFRLDPEDLYRVPGPVNLNRLIALYDRVDRPDLKYGPFVPGTPPKLPKDTDVFEVLRRQDVLLHHPFQSFAPVVDLLRQAAADPDVLAIKITLYRTDPKSPLLQALLEAARSGKEVTAVVELRARFDEARNIALATKLEEVGANVVYGIVGYKAHAKMALVVRREKGRLRRYVHLGTGNYHSVTARAYTDLGLLSSRPDLGADVHSLFLQLTGIAGQEQLRVLLQSPFTLADRVIELIEAEAEASREGRPCGIKAKMNTLSDPEVVRALYRASQAGVPIDLWVRGACALRPGLPGVSETIRVRSVVGRFLEHSRVYYFENGGDPQVWLASADWMPRNLHRRVETAFPIADDTLRRRIIDECLSTYEESDAGAWELLADGSYQRTARPADVPPRSAQQALLDRLAR